MSAYKTTRLSRPQIAKFQARRSAGKRQKRQADSLALHPLLQMQQTHGNHAVGRFIQAQLKVSQPGDQYEQEADRVADHIMRMPNPATVADESKQSLQSPPAIQRLCTECEVKMQRQPIEEEKKSEEQLQRQAKPGHNPTVHPNFHNQITNLQTGGRLLQQAERAFFEPRFGRDFSQVRVHTDGQAANIAKSINAKALTIGRNIAFGAGEYRPETTTGRKLMAHELTHVVQQNSGRAGADDRSIRVQRTIGDGHDLASPRFKGDPDLEGCYDDETRLTMGDLGQPGTKKVESGPSVKAVQDALVELGYLAPAHAIGIYNEPTWNAVKTLKKDKSLGWEHMGDVGPGTMSWLDKNFQGGKECPPCPSLEPRPSPCLPCPPILPVPPQPVIPPGPIKPPGSPFEFCVPFLTKAEALQAHSVFTVITLLFAEKFGKEVRDLYSKYLFNPKSGSKGTLPPRQVFGNQHSRIVNEFRQDPETQKQKDRIMKLLATRIRSNPSLMPLPGQSTPLLDFRVVLNDSELLDLPMSFSDPANKIPGFIAGGFGKASSDAGDDVRNVDGKFIATNLGLSTLQIRANFIFDVLDCVDFCPGASGSGLALGLTIPISKLEATPDVPTYDVPFEVVYGLSDKQSF